MDVLVLMVLIAALGSVALVARRRSRARDLVALEALAPARALAFEDVTAFGEDLAALDIEIAGHALDDGATADYQRALDTYESAKVAGDSITQPDDISELTGLIDDGRHAIACVRARVSGAPLPTRRPPCFFDPGHGPSVADVPFAPANGVERRVPACLLDTERVRAGAEPATRQVQVGGRRVAYWDAGRAYQPYAAGYFGVDALTWLFLGSFAMDGLPTHYDDSSADHGGTSGDGGGLDAGAGEW